MSRKTKRNKENKDTDKFSLPDYAMWVIVFLACLIVARYGLEYIMGWFASMQTTVNVIRPAKIDWNNGLPLLIIYLSVITGFIVCGYAMGAKVNSRL